MAASLRKDASGTISRIANWISKDKYVDVPNLYAQLYPKTEKLTAISVWTVPGDVGDWVKYPFDEVIKQKFKPAAIGDVFGPTWSTHWFKLEFAIPSSWKGKEVRLRWDSQSEAMIYDESGKPLQGLASRSSNRRTDYILSTNYQGGGPYVYYMEMACNHLFGGGSGPFGDIEPPDPDRKFSLLQAEIAVFDRSVYKLIMDLDVLLNMCQAVSEDDPRSFDAMYTANEMVTLHIKGKDKEASDLADAFFAQKNGEGTHTLGVMGNCHIDSAWLWPYSETKRKAARSFSSQLGLMKIYDDYKFVASQAQQYAWVKEYYPSLFEEIKTMVAKGKFIPAGGAWIEMDGNMPSGESFIRQFLFGQRFFQKEFGVTCKEFWLPDTFGYSANIPQILQHMGIKRFLTQKLSWNFFNKFPHQSFFWEGIDGSTVLAHFPPGDSYCLEARAQDAVFTVKNLRDKGRTHMSGLLYGYGDGGGGPIEDMVERANRLEDVNGVPKMKKIVPDDLFTSLEGDADKLMRWTGELFLELHNGTYTTQAEIKRLNRRCEMKLHDTELMLTAAFTLNPSNEEANLEHQNNLTEAWKKVLLNQFHDVLPGSCIELAVQDAHKTFHEALDTAQAIYDDCWNQLFGSKGNDVLLVNSLCWERSEVSHVSTEIGKLLEAQGATVQYDDDGAWVLLTVGPMGCTVPTGAKTSETVSLKKVKDVYSLSNSLIESVIDKYGRVASLRLVGNSKEVVPEGEHCNQLLIYSDMPIYWDAWDLSDYHLESRQEVNYAGAPGQTDVRIEADGPLVSSLSWSVDVGNDSHLKQTIMLRVGSPYLEFHTEVDWKENRKVLKVEFPVDLLIREATYDIQFGSLNRMTNANTSWDWAKYEVCGHKWADISENGYGVSVMNDSKYGWSAVGNRLTMSLLKAPKKPDAHADMQVHHFKYALMPHEGTFREAGTVKRALEFNMPIVTGTADASKITIPKQWFSVDSDSVILDTVKPTEDNAPGAYVLRLFESHGKTTTADVTVNLPVKKAWVCGGMEDKKEELRVNKKGNGFKISLNFKPYQLTSILIETPA